MNKCKHCGETVPRNTTHYCEETKETYDWTSFVMSAAIGYGTDSAIVGTLLGDNLLGGILGDSLDGDLFD